MNRLELAERIGNGESSGVDFKRDDVPAEKLAKVAAAFLNFEVGTSCSASRMTVRFPG